MTNKITYHRDGTVSFWDVYRRQWARRTSQPTDQQLATLRPYQVDKIHAHLDKVRSYMKVKGIHHVSQLSQ